jgi:hypothetical protein
VDYTVETATQKAKEIFNRLYLNVSSDKVGERQYRSMKRLEFTFSSGKTRRCG